MDEKPKCDLRELVLLRHGESVWNRENLFTGWTDVDLSDQGREEAKMAGLLLKENGITFDLAFTSVLKRAIRTLWIVLDSMDLMWIPVHRSWRLNERNYGALQGLNKTQTAERFGERQVRLWRRSYDTRPPALEDEDPRNPRHDERYRELAQQEIPATESLKDTLVRVLPFWQNQIAPKVFSGKRVLVAAHGNSLRALVKYLDGISDEDIVSLNIPTGVPLVYEFNEELKPVLHYYLGDTEQTRTKMRAVENQTLRKQ